MSKSPHWYEQGLPHIWLPYSQMKLAPPPLPVVSTEGCEIVLADGRRLIDGISSWWSACHGYNHPHILQSVEKQLKQMPHIMLGGLVHEQALTLAKRLAAITNLPRAFFSDSGSTAVEVALKMAIQYWRNKGQNNRNKILCFHDGYHGDTLGAMSVSDPEHGLHKAFRNLVAKQFVLGIPQDEYAFAEFETLLDGVHKSIAALIIEPLMQGAGGMRFHSPDVLAYIHKICKKYDILFIADEIAVGFGRTGTLFACQQAGITPDIMCLGKALTGGVMGLAVTMASEQIFNGFYTDDPDHAFMHGPTFMGNALGCAAANASLDLFEREPRLAQVEQIERLLHEGLKPCESLPGVVDVRILGAIGVVQIDTSKFSLTKLKSSFIEKGVWLRPLGDVVYVMPPLVIKEEQLNKLTASVQGVVAAAQ